MLKNIGSIKVGDISAGIVLSGFRSCQKPPSVPSSGRCFSREKRVVLLSFHAPLSLLSLIP
jgi:hypothetical protein